MIKVDPREYRIMVVDDDPTALLMISSILQDEGYQVLEVSDGQAASNMIGNEEFDVILADFNMPGMDGISLLRRAKLLVPSAVRMMLTGEGDYDTAIQAINMGEVYRFMSKPVDEHQLKLHTLRACERVGLEREVVRLRKEMKKRDKLLVKLERDNPGITRVQRRGDGVIVLDDVFIDED